MKSAWNLGQKSQQLGLFFLVLVSLMTFSGCSPATSDSVLSQNQDPVAQGCASSVVKNRYVVQWQDGTFTVETARNEEEFRREFIDPQLSLIKHIDRDIRIQIKPILTNELSEQASSGEVNWGSEKIQAPALWSQGIKGNNIIVGVVDGMVDKNHKQLKTNVISVQQFNNEINNPMTNRHGSHVAGIIAADSDLGSHSGVAPKAKIVGGQFIGNEGGGTLGEAILALNSVADRGAKIINMSWGGAPCVSNLQDALQALSNRGILLITASGNEAKDSDIFPTYPAGFGFPRQINVGATDLFDLMARFSVRGYRTVNIMAPGVGIISTIPNNQYESMDGTSMAAPMVSGAAALIWSAKPNATADQIKNSLLKGIDLSPGQEFQVSSRGRLNVKKALDELNNMN